MTGLKIARLALAAQRIRMVIHTLRDKFAETTAFSVGYESASQFSRDYSRLVSRAALLFW